MCLGLTRLILFSASVLSTIGCGTGFVTGCPDKPCYEITVPAYLDEDTAGLGQAILKFNPREGWRSYTRFEYPYSATPGLVFDNVFYVLGGNNFFIGQSYTTIYRSEDGLNWVPHGDIPEQLISPTAVQYNDKIYLFGGVYLSAVNSNVYVTNDLQNWSVETTMPTPVFGASSFELDGKIYTLGGADASFQYDDLQIYDPSTGTWTFELAVVPGLTNLSYTTIVEHRGSFYTVGGADGLHAHDEVRRYQWNSGRYEFVIVGYLPASRSRGKAISYMDRIWFMGGYDELGNTSSDMWSSPDGAEWQEEPSLPVKISDAVAFLIERGY